MKSVKFIKNKWSVYFLILCFAFAFSCSKQNEELAQKEASKPIEKEETIDENNLNESAEDLMQVDYKDFYDQLAPHGEWIQVKASDLGIDTKKLQQNADLKQDRSFLDVITGVNNAYASDVNVDLGLFFVWQPAPDLAVSMTTTNVAAPVYVPYTNGQWVNTDAGWYFAAATPYEDITMHYGRWVYTPDMGYVWMPGRVWSPAWVDWRYGNDYVAWSPLPPEAVFVDNVLIEPVPIVATNYVVVPTMYFMEPQIYTYTVWDPVVRETIVTYPRIDGLVVTNNVIVNQGPDVTIIENISGKHFEKIKINRVDNISKVKFSEKEIYTYSPRFVHDVSGKKRYVPVSEPKSFKEFSTVRSTVKNENREPKQPGNITDQKNMNKEQVQKENKNGAYKDNKNEKNQKFSNKNYKKDQNGTVKKNNKWNNKQNDNNKSGNKQNKIRNGNKNKGNDNQQKYNKPQQKQKQQPQTKQKDQNNKQQPQTKQKDQNNKQQPQTKQKDQNNKQQPQDKNSGNGNGRKK
jgi:hypothetical protein